MPIGLGQVAPRQIAIALEQPRLVGVERLADAVDKHLLGRARRLPADRPTRSRRRRGGPAQAADLAAHADRLGRAAR